jgi:protocatechuate 3,4-dioxygenase beta subunit
MVRHWRGFFGIQVRLSHQILISSHERIGFSPLVWGRVRVGGTTAALAVALVVLTVVTQTPAQAPEPSTITGRVLDADGRPIAGARVRLYRRASRWERVHPLVAEAHAAPDGSFRIDAAKPEAAPGFRDYPRRVLLADHPGHAVGWRLVPDDAAIFAGDITLTAPAERTITVTDADGRPLAGATVAAYHLGDQASESPHFRETLDLRVEDGPLAATTDARGQAHFTNLPKTNVSFVAGAPGQARTFVSHDQDTIRLTPAATLAGTVTDPDGMPLAGVKLVLQAVPMGHFDHANTDARGRYQFDGLPAKGWDLGIRRSGPKGDGTYKLWIEDDRFAIQTQFVTLEPDLDYELDLRTEPAGTIVVTVVEAGTETPLVGARVNGFDVIGGQEPNGRTDGRRFNAYTDAQGRATFHAAPAEIVLHASGPPEGTFIEGNLSKHPGARRAFGFEGGTEELTLSMPPIAGRLIRLPGTCTRPDGMPAAGVTVHAATDRAITMSGGSYLPPRRTDDAGRFILDDVPEGRTLNVLAIADDGTLANAAALKAPTQDAPQPPVAIALRPTVTTTVQIEAAPGRTLAERDLTITPKIGDDEFHFLRLNVKTNDQGQVTLERILPGLSYRVVEQRKPVAQGDQAGFVVREAVFNQVVVLVPEEDE